MVDDGFRDERLKVHIADDTRQILMMNQAELAKIEAEIKYHRDEFNASIAGIMAVRQELKDANNTLRSKVVETWGDSTTEVEGVSVSYRNDFEVNEAELGVEYFKTEVDSVRIKRELVLSDWTKPIPGVTVIQKPSLRISKT